MLEPAVVDRRYPSSKTCSGCCAVNEALTLGTRTWACTACGELPQREHNAAKNILAESIRAHIRTTIPGAGASACGEVGSGRARKRPTKPASTKQEVNA